MTSEKYDPFCHIHVVDEYLYHLNEDEINQVMEVNVFMVMAYIKNSKSTRTGSAF